MGAGWRLGHTCPVCVSGWPLAGGERWGLDPSPRAQTAQRPPSERPATARRQGLALRDSGWVGWFFVSNLTPARLSPHVCGVEFKAASIPDLEHTQASEGLPGWLPYQWKSQGVSLVLTGVVGGVPQGAWGPRGWRTQWGWAWRGASGYTGALGLWGAPGLGCRAGPTSHEFRFGACFGTCPCQGKEQVPFGDWTPGAGGWPPKA